MVVGIVAFKKDEVGKSYSMDLKIRNAKTVRFVHED
jgi:hypothetical protein